MAGQAWLNKYFPVAGIIQYYCLSGVHFFDMSDCSNVVEAIRQKIQPYGP